MNRTNAKKIAETITNEDLLKMLLTAKEKIKDWSVVSSVNKGMTKGVGWNILAKDFDVNKNYHIMAKINMVREFGEYLSAELLPTKKVKNINTNVHHEEPKF